MTKNRAKCNNCKVIIESIRSHDFMTCPCFREHEEGGHGIFIDGGSGQGMRRYGYKNAEDFIFVNDDDSEETLVARTARERILLGSSPQPKPRGFVKYTPLRDDDKVLAFPSYQSLTEKKKAIFKEYIEGFEESYGHSRWSEEIWEETYVELILMLNQIF